MEQIYLYTGLRTKHTEKIGEAQCLGTRTITINNNSIVLHDMLTVNIDTPEGLDQFAVADGFNDWQSMKQFWIKEHGPDCFPFTGTIIYWSLLSKKNWKKQTPKERKHLRAQFTTPPNPKSVSPNLKTYNLCKH